MKRTNTLIIGGGQAGLAMSRSLIDLAVDNVVLERGRIGERWRSERWDSLHLLTPRWQSRLPGFRYQGAEPEGYMSRTEVVDYLDAYAGSFDAPVASGTTVSAVKRHPWGFRVITDRGEWLARNVVIATGHSARPRVPRMAGSLDGDLVQMVPTAYRNPDSLPDGGVLVVGAAATGIQLASEIHASGRAVTLAVGAHTRIPRLYRGRDIMWWLDAMGVLTELASHRSDLDAARSEPSLHLVGCPDHHAIDLGVAQKAGIRLAGRAMGVDGGRVMFADDLPESMAVADERLARLLERIDRYIEMTGLQKDAPAAAPLRALPVPRVPSEIDLKAAGIKSVLWATGYSRSYPWLHIPVLDPNGEIRHEGGITPEPGLYVIGLHFMRRRNSTFLDGVGADARDLAEHIGQRMNALWTTRSHVSSYGYAAA
jgi:putative flavoprotein involved in K+ transport